MVRGMSRLPGLLLCALAEIAVLCALFAVGTADANAIVPLGCVIVSGPASFLIAWRGWKISDMRTLLMLALGEIAAAAVIVLSYSMWLLTA